MTKLRETRLFRRVARCASFIASWGVIASYAGAATGQAPELRTLRSGTGAEIVYGPLHGYQDLSNAAIYMLHQVHGHYGSKPETCGFFQSKSGDTLGTFFNVEDKNFTHSSQSGLLLISQTPKGEIKVAVLTDRSGQFRGSIGGMMKALQENWGGNGAGRTAEIQPLQVYAFPDRSGYVKLAPGWRPLIARSGGIIAAGPRGESMELSCYLGVLDARNPQVQRRMMSGGLPPMYAAVPSGSDPASAFSSLYNQLLAKHGIQGGQVRVSLVKQGPSQLGTDFTLAGEIDSPQMGRQKIVAIMSAARSPRMQGWSCIISAVTAPDSLFDQEANTLFAMSRSLTQDANVIYAQSDEVVKQLHQYGDAVKSATNSRNAWFDEKMSEIDKTHLSEEQNGKGFSDFLRDQAVVEHIPSGARGTISNNSAYELAQEDPVNWRVVPNDQLIKGKDF